MKHLKKIFLLLFLGAAFQISAQETTEKLPSLDKDIENFELPSFSKLSNDIASDYNLVLESLPDLSNIGKHIDKEIRRGLFDEHNVANAFRNFNNENSILPNISAKRFQLRNSLNNIMFNGYDINQLHMGEAYRRN